METTYVNRKPICTSNVTLHAYELNSQPREDRRSVLTGEEFEALHADLGTFSDVGLDQIVGDHPAFVNLSRDAVVSRYCLSLSKHRVVLEILDDIVSDTALKNELLDLSMMGYKIALRYTMPPALKRNGRSIADIIRVNVRDLNDKQLADQTEQLSRLSVPLLAVNVDTYEQFELCKKHNFDMYQGYFLCAPNNHGSKLPINRMAALHVLGKLQDPDLSLNELEASISTDVTLSYKLLRFANSAFIGLNRSVESIQHAAKIVGLERIRLWASLLMFSKMDDKPRELIITAIVRAAMCERLASSAGEGPRESFFTVGLLSALDALMDCPMEEAIEALPLSSELTSALSRGEGSRGEALQCVLAYERGDWDRVRYRDLQPMTIRSHYLDSLVWTRRTSEGLSL